LEKKKTESKRQIVWFRGEKKLRWRAKEYRFRLTKEERPQRGKCSRTTEFKEERVMRKRKKETFFKTCNHFLQAGFLSFSIEKRSVSFPEKRKEEGRGGV